jgi:hypothetical protein
MKVPTIRIKRRVDVGTIYDLASIVCNNLKSHDMANVLSNTDPATTFLTGIGRKIGVIDLVVDRFIPPEEQQRTDIILPPPS